MQEKEMVFLGCKQGVSKKTGKKFYLCYFYSKVDIPGVGYEPHTFFVNEEELNKLHPEDLLKKFIVQYVYAGGQKVYVASRLVK